MKWWHVFRCSYAKYKMTSIIILVKIKGGKTFLCFNSLLNFPWIYSLKINQQLIWSHILFSGEIRETLFFGFFFFCLFFFFGSYMIFYMFQWEKGNFESTVQIPWKCKGLFFLALTIFITWRSSAFRSDQISRSVMSDSLQPHESQHTRPPCPSPTPGVHSDSCP